ncbi:ankyrin repeat-containing domain protein [Mycena albidolilacea]|uniref:Ankyrin repeat-containing domain protein n=1 Tax=Mycena albidolilacea TaxID=1033008 RepID=A0AAD6ZFW9_9AGAR|nr:ankyrin repeat-containing domain protein [Mycena albidolilacea]
MRIQHGLRILSASSMADLVALIASVLQLVDTVAKAGDYLQDFRNAPKDQQQLLLEIQNLDPLIRKLDQCIRSDRACGTASIIQHFEEPLTHLEVMLERLKKKLDLDDIKKFSSRLTWSLWGKDEVNEALGAIERFKSSLAASSGMDILDSIHAMQTANNYSTFGPRERPTPATPRKANEFQTANTYCISHISGGTGGPGGSGGKEGGGGGVGEGPTFQAATMHVVIKNPPPDMHSRPPVEADQSAERRQIIEWTSPLNFFPRQADILSTRQPGTGEWLLQNRLFKKWKTGEIQALWCRGMPGAGKTVLASIVIDDLRANLTNENTGVAVLYLDHKATEIQSTSNLLAAIWRQLAPGKLISSLVYALYRKHYEHGTRPSLEETYSMLHSTVSECSCVFIVVDAHDGYLEAHRDTLLRLLCKLGPAVRLMLTSRPHISIDHVISNIETLDVRATEEDIRKYLDEQILKSSRLSRHVNKSSSLRESIEKNIVKCSDGMFLLAKLNIDSLTTKQTVAAVQEALMSLPSELDGAYDDIVDRINRQSEDDRQLAWRTLSWALNAKRPLRPSQLREALSVEPGATALDPDRLTDMDIILSVCAGLVIFDEVDDKVRLIHYTTQMYLQSAHVQTSMFPHAQSKITLRCITYMALTFEAFTRRLQQPLLLFTHNPFLHYAVEYCLVHAHGEPETHIKHWILSFLANCSTWWRLCNWKHGERQSAPEKLRIALAFHLEVICRHIIDENGVGNLLQEAASRGATDEVRILLKHGVNVENEGNTLQEAVAHGHEEIVRLLLVHGADNNSRGPNSTVPQGHEDLESAEHGRMAQVSVNAESRIRYGTALYHASRTGNEAIVKLLIEHGADINADGGEHGSALQAALWNGQEGVARLLIEHGAKFKAEGGEYGTALQVAVRQGREGIIRLLIEYGTDINAEGGEYDGVYGSLLQAALWNGKEGAARLLVEHGADVNAEGGKYGNPLQAALWNGKEGTAQLLIEHGADANAEGGEYGSLLQAALWNGKEEAARLLIEHGADVNAEGGKYGNPLQAALWNGKEGTAQLLIEHGADINAEDGVYGSLLQAALWNGKEGAARLLIEHGADVNAEGEEYGSALHAALWMQHEIHESVVELLIQRGADVNAKGRRCGTALQVAACQGRKGIIQLLIEHGADINAEGGEHGSALCVASKWGHKAIVKLLIKHGADVKAEGGEYGSALCVASSQGHTAIVKWLLKHGADVKADSALSLASSRGHKAIAKLLLEHGANVDAESRKDEPLAWESIGLDDLEPLSDSDWVEI